MLQISLLLLNILNVYSFDVKLDLLTNNFFENLEDDPLLQANNELNDYSRQFIEKQVANFLNLVGHEETGPINKRKRSLLDKLTKEVTGTYLLSGVEASVTIPAKFPVDVALFRQNSQWYAAVLESSEKQEYADDLVILQYLEEQFSEKARLNVTNGVKLATITMDNATLIAVAENDTSKDNFHEKSGIYRFKDGRLVQIQSIDMHYASDIVLWRMHNEVYMSVAQFMSNKTGNFSYEVEIPIYKWLGQHFDLIQIVKGSGVRKITPFTVNHHNFLATANSKDDGGNTKIYSDVYKYNYDLDRYVLYQRILTRACNDIKFFNLSQNGRSSRDHFLIVANSFEEDSYGNINYQTDSIMYKFVDDYFIPFQSFELTAVEDWLPVEGPNNEFVLFASCRFDGLKSFQYDGWVFREVPQITNKQLLEEGVKSLRSISFDRNPTIVVTNKNHISNLYKLKFTHHNTLNGIYDDMMKWCEQGYEKIHEMNEGDLFDQILGKVERADIEEQTELPLESDQVEVKIEKISSKIEALNLLLEGLNSTNLKPEIITLNYTVDEMVFNGGTFIHNLNTSKINNFDTDQLLGKKLDIDEGFDLEEINLKSVKIEGTLSPKMVNGREPNTLIHRSDDVKLDLLTVRGTLVASDGIQIKGNLNGVTVNDRNLLLSVGDQNLSRPLSLNSVKIGRMSAKSLNGENLSRLQPLQSEIINIDHLQDLQVKNLTIGGYINDVHVPTLQKYALKASGNQEITADYSFDLLKGNNLEVEGQISGRKLSELIPIHQGDYSIDQDLIFTNNLTVNNLIVLEFLNGIEVHDEKLDILLKDLPEEQQITGEKIFDDLVIYHAIYLQGNIKSEELEKMNPMVTIDEEVVVEGDRMITGNVQVEDFLNVANMVTSDGTYSLIKLQTEGVKLTDEEIQPRLCFVQQLNVGEIFVDTINGQDPSNFVVIGGEDTQIIQSSKVFLGDLYITGTTNAFKINDVDVEELEHKVLKVEGDQIIIGKHHIKHVIVDKVNSNDTRFGTINWSDLRAANANEAVTTEGDFHINSITTETITVRGLINDLDFDSIVEDTVTKDDDRKIEGFKYFQNLTVDNLRAQNGVTDKMFVNTNQITLKGPLNMKNLQVQNLYFEDEINGVERESFGKYELDEDGRRIIEGNHIFDIVRLYRRAYIASNKINNVRIDDLVENTVKIDEPFEFDVATFETEVVSKNPVLLEGHVENLDFDNLVLSGLVLEQTIFDEKVFDNLTVNGSVHFDGSVNTINITRFCEFAMGQIDSKNLLVDGDAVFVKGPNVKEVNNVDVATIWKEAWFKDRPTTLTGYVEFDTITFNEDIDVKGFVDNVSLRLLSENYFSRSKEQNITATFNFQNDLTFESDVSVPEMTVNGEVNGISLDSFVRTALLNNYDQVFESIVYLENCTVTTLSGDYVVNDIDLDQDVMRYDKANMVTGAKSFDNLNVDLLKLEKNIKIQDVDVLDWFKSSVMKSTSFNITGRKSFGNVLFANGVQVDGTLNGQNFDRDHIMVKNLPQDITGNKTILTNSFDPLVFKVIKLKGLLNDIQISDLIKNQAFKNQDNTFKTSLNFHNNITTTNLVVRETYQGINMTELITNVTNLGALNNLLERYDDLLVMSYKLEESIKRQAYFVHHYKIIQTIPHITNSQKILLADGATNLGTLVTDGSDVRMDLYRWHDQEESFLFDESITLGQKPLNFVDQVLMGRYLYMERDGTGRFVPMDKSLDTATIPTNTTRSTASFLEPSTNEICTLFAYFECAPRIYCENEEGIRLVQTLGTSKAVKATTTTIDDCLYLIVIDEPINGVEPRIDLWQLNNQTNHFEMHQSLFEAQPKSIATALYHGFAYLAIASGHLQNAMYSGRVELRRFDEVSKQFLPLQSLELDAPLQVEFSILPSDELLLYILTDNPTEPLLVYRYEGIAGFNLIVSGSTLPEILYINQFVGAANSHLIVAQSYDEINVIRAIFKGEKVTED